jgi:hypothetical protein
MLKNQYIKEVTENPGKIKNITIGEVTKGKPGGAFQTLMGNSVKYESAILIGDYLWLKQEIHDLYKKYDNFLGMDFDDPRILDYVWAKLAYEIFLKGIMVIDFDNDEIEHEQEKFLPVKKDPNAIWRGNFSVDELAEIRRICREKGKVIETRQSTTNKELFKFLPQKARQNWNDLKLRPLNDICKQCEEKGLSNGKLSNLIKKNGQIFTEKEFYKKSIQNNKFEEYQKYLDYINPGNKNEDTNDDEERNAEEEINEWNKRWTRNITVLFMIILITWF